MKKLLVVAAFALAACSDAAGSDGVRVDVTKPAAGSVRLRYTVTNLGPREIYLVTCGPTVWAQAQKQVNGGWTTPNPVFCTGSVSPPIPVIPGGTVADSVMASNAGVWRVAVPYIPGGGDVPADTVYSGGVEVVNTGA